MEQFERIIREYFFDSRSAQKQWGGLFFDKKLEIGDLKWIA